MLYLLARPDSYQIACFSRSVPLRCKAEYPASSEEWRIDMDELEASFSDKTRLLVINSPHNPTGKVFSRAELEGMANASWHCEYEGPQE
jgi:aspartate/methionine/tyrosine aminotransferase